MFNRTPNTASLQISRDKKLVRKILAGDELAFKSFVDEYFPKLYRYAYHRLGNKQDVEEVVQVVLSNAARWLGTFRGEATLLTWMVRICRNEISQHLAKLEQRNDLAMPFLDDDVLRSIVESIESDPGDEPEAVSQRNDLITLVQLALDQLPERYAAALELKYIEGYSSKEIARQFEIGDEAVQSMLARARRAFREVCSEAIFSLLDMDQQLRSPPQR